MILKKLSKGEINMYTTYHEWYIGSIEMPRYFGSSATACSFFLESGNTHLKAKPDI